ncbi:MAG TPA: hypothetical protein VHN74_17745 [Candidatus Angelobacter sp.]|nr:hypothetical protein [Candidatus Angelobacter sp.]
MACRIQNLSRHRLALDLRGGRVVYVEPNQVSAPLREESLYDNVHLRTWEQQGLARRIDASMDEVLEYEGRPATKKGTRSTRDKSTADKSQDASGEKPASQSGKVSGSDAAQAASAQVPKAGSDGDSDGGKKSSGRAPKE